MNFDIAVFQWLNSGAGLSPYINWFIVFGAKTLLYLMIAAFFLFPLSYFSLKFRWLFFKNTELFIVGLFSALIARYGVAELIRLFYDRARPFEVLDNVILLINHTPGDSFPSGHAVFAFALAAAVLQYYPRIGAVFFLAAVLVGIGRIASGVHWPSDILEGMGIGILVSYLFLFFFNRLKKNGRMPFS